MTSRRRIVFVARSFAGESIRSALAVTRLENTELFGICDQQPLTAHQFRDKIRVADTRDPNQLTEAAKQLQQKHGSLNRIVTTYETLLEPVAHATEALGLEGMSVATVQRALNKSSLIATLRQAGVGTAQSRVCTGEAEARSFALNLGYPVVLKPLNGSGGLATWAIGNDAELNLALELTDPSPARPLLVEECLHGQEVSIDTITIANEPRFYSICCYTPTILQAIQNPAIQWACVMPRDISEFYQPLIAQGLDAVRALSVGDAMTHMEAFVFADGRVCFTDATLRPAGARIAPMLAYAYDIDPYFAWARATLDGCFDGPWRRKFAVGTIFLHGGAGSGTVISVQGLESVERKLGDALVDVCLPRVGATKASTYTGDGYVTVRHPETIAVKEALDFIAQKICINYSNSETSATLRDEWSRRLQYDRLYKPAWEIDSQIM